MGGKNVDTQLDYESERKKKSLPIFDVCRWGNLMADIMKEILTKKIEDIKKTMSRIPIDIDFNPGQQYTLGYSRLIYLRRVKAKVPMWMFRYSSGPLETFTEWQLEDALHPPKRSGPRPESKWKPPKDTPFKRTFGKGQKIRPPKKGDGN